MIPPEKQDAEIARKFPGQRETLFQRRERPAFERDIEKANERFNADLGRYRDGSMGGKDMFLLGMPSETLRKAGLPDKPVVMEQSALYDKTHQHGFKPEDVRDLPKQLGEPVAVFDSPTRDDSKIVVTEIKTKEGSLVAAIRIRPLAGNIVVNSIRSLHGRSDPQLESMVDRGYLRLVDKERGRWLLERSGRMQRQVSSGQRPTPDIIVYTKAEVKPGGQENRGVQFQKREDQPDAKEIIAKARERARRTKT